MSPNNPMVLADLSESAFNSYINLEVYSYIKGVVTQMREAVPATEQDLNAKEIVSRAFDLLTARKFCYLSKKRVSKYRENILAHFHKQVAESKPLTLFLDIGGGYHASLYPGKQGLCFVPGLGEFFILSQIKQFNDGISTFYPPGVKFSLVVDNYSALLINDVSVSNTGSFCRELRKLIRESGMSQLVDVLVESENFSLGTYHTLVNEFKIDEFEISDKEISNISRFLGRPCSTEEALARAIRYKAVTSISEKLFDTIIDGVHMTQRATPATICFRAFPGSDSRIQCGEVAISINEKGKIFPVLITSGNIHQFIIQKMSMDELLPNSIEEVIFAEPQNDLR